MKSKLILVVFFFVQLILFSQEAYQPMREWSRWSIGIGASADWSYRYLNETDLTITIGSFTPQDLIEDRNEFEKPSFGFTAGILSEYMISKRFSLEFGVFYAKRGYQTGEIRLTDDTGTGAGVSYAKWYYHFMDIPVRINLLSKLSERWFLSSGLGITSNILIRRGFKSHLEWTSGRVEDYNDIYTSDYDMFNLSPTISISMGYKLSDRSVIKAGPTYRYAILSPTETPITEHLYQLGFQCSYSIRL